MHGDDVVWLTKGLCIMAKIIDPNGYSASRGVGSPDVFVFHDARTGSLQYVVVDPETSACALIDPVLDYDEKSGQVDTWHADALLAFVADNGYRLEWILDTHPHADHFSAASYLREQTGAPIAIGRRICEVQKIWNAFYDMPDCPTDGSQWDRLFDDGDSFAIGALNARVMFSPGHTLASITYHIGDAAFIHDTLFSPDSGTARADFPGGSAVDLWQSIQRILNLAPDTRLFTGHDYRPAGRPLQWETTPQEQRQSNTHISKYLTQDTFVAARQERDRTLPMPKLILHALQVNINAGTLPAAEGNGRHYLKIPLGVLAGAAWG